MNDAREGEGFLEAEPVQAARTVVALNRCHDDVVVVDAAFVGVVSMLVLLMLSSFMFSF